MAERILIIHPEGNIKNNPNLWYFVRILTEKGYRVTVFSDLHPCIYQGSLPEGAEFMLIPARRSLVEFRSKRHLLNEGFHFILGVDEGIIGASEMAGILNVPYGFISYEIFFDDELKVLKDLFYTDLKRKSKRACRGVAFAVVQDETRKQLLCKEYGVPEDRIRLMPVAGRGTREIRKNKYFHSQLGIPPEKRILLYMGWVDELMVNRLATYAPCLPGNWALVIHSRYKYTGKHPEILNNLPGKVWFSFDHPVEDIEEMGTLLGGADAGFCTYQATFDSPYTGKNIEMIGLSSGKTATFLQYGIPVVIHNMNIWNEIVEKEQVGFSMTDPSDLEKLDLLLDESYSRNCRRYFSASLDISSYAPPILEQIATDIQKPGPEKRINRWKLAFFLAGAITGTVLNPFKRLKKKVARKIKSLI